MKRPVPVSHPTKPTPGFVGAPVESASALIDEKIKELGDWRGKTLAKVREIIHEADPEVVEEWKWLGSPVWSHDGIIAVANAHKDKVKLTFSHGASLSARGQFCAVEKPASRLRPKAGSSNSARNDMVWGMSLYSATLRRWGCRR